MHSTGVTSVRFNVVPRCFLKSSLWTSTLRELRTLRRSPVSSMLYTFSGRMAGSASSRPMMATSVGPCLRSAGHLTSNQSVAAAELWATDGAGRNLAANSFLGVECRGWDLWSRKSRIVSAQWPERATAETWLGADSRYLPTVAHILPAPALLEGEVLLIGGFIGNKRLVLGPTP